MTTAALKLKQLPPITGMSESWHRKKVGTWRTREPQGPKPIHIGKSVRFLRGDVELWLQQQRDK